MLRFSADCCNLPKWAPLAQSGGRTTFLSWLVTSLLVMVASLVVFTPAQAAQLEGFDHSLLGGIAPLGPNDDPVFTAALTPATAAVGDEVTLQVHVELPDTFYIYGTKGSFGGRTEIALDTAHLEALDAEWVPDRPEELKFEPLFNVELSKFYGAVTWSRRFRVQAGGTPTVRGELTGQYCSNPEDGTGQCVPIRPPFTFEASVALATGVPVSETPVPEVASTGAAPVSTSQDEATGPVVLTTVSAGPFVPTAVQQPKYSGATPARWTAMLAPADAKPGDTVTLALTANLDSGWHTFSTTQEGLGGSPTELEIEELVGLVPTEGPFVPTRPFEVETPQPDTRLEVYYGEITWTRTFTVAPGTPPGEYGLQASVVFQLCNDSVCKVPKQLVFPLGRHPDAKLLADPTPASNATTSTLEAPVSPAATTAGPSTPVTGRATPGSEGLLPFLLTAIGFGYVSLLTPCVFPMVPITVSFFLKQSESKHSRPLLLALVYCGCIVLTFTVLGVGISALFGAGGLNQLANLPLFNIVIGVVFIVFALNMLGMFELRVPSWLLNATATRESAGGYVGAIFMALTFTLTSFTCTFAFAGTLLVAAAQGSYLWPALGMLAFGTAFASPFFVLAMIPSLLKQLPKSGGWMNSVKVVMGLIELAAAVKFLSVADLSLNPSGPIFFDFPMVMLLWIVVGFLVSIYLLGWLRLPHDTPLTSISVPRALLAGFFLVATGFLTQALFQPERGGWLHNKVVAFAPPRYETKNDSSGHAGLAADLNNMAGVEGPTLTHHGLVFALDFDKAVALATRQNRPLFVDFTGVNCVNCREMELKMAQPAWKQSLSRFVGAQLYVDVPGIPTVADAKYARQLWQQNQKLQEDLLHDTTMPLYAVVSSDGKTVYGSYTGQERVSGEFIEFLDTAYQKWSASTR